MFLAAALCLFAWPAAANDQALIDFIGYSGDFRYFAFETPRRVRLRVFEHSYSRSVD